MAWLHFLREFDLGGILADDMGLGKTVQALAHILLEKRGAARRGLPWSSAPTSVVPNWMGEAAALGAGTAGPSRCTAPTGSPPLSPRSNSDLVMTTYALLPREPTCCRLGWHLAVLDEAQAIKNPDEGQRSLHGIDARHRLCLTGTPVENHLGDSGRSFLFL